MGWLSRLFGGGAEPSGASGNRTVTFEHIPDGRYPVRFVSEAGSYDQFVLVTLEVVAGEHKGASVPMVLKSVKARQAMRDRAGDYIAYMDFLADGRAGKLYSAIMYADSDTDGVFIVNYKDGAVTSVPEHDAEAVERLVEKLGAGS